MTKPMPKEQLREEIAKALWKDPLGETTVSDWVDSWKEVPEHRKIIYREKAGQLLQPVQQWCDENDIWQVEEVSGRLSAKEVILKPVRLVE